jgi:hypothetical protein
MCILFVQENGSGECDRVFASSAIRLAEFLELKCISFVQENGSGRI